MTTIVITRDALYVDSQITCAGTFMSAEPKLFGVKGVGAVALAGVAGTFAEVAEWVLRGCSKGDRPCKDLEWVAYFMSCNGQRFAVKNDEGIQPLHDDVYFDGSGALVARGAYHVNNDPLDAMRAAIDLDLYTSGEIASYHFLNERMVGGDMREHNVDFRGVEGVNFFK